MLSSTQVLLDDLTNTTHRHVTRTTPAFNLTNRLAPVKITTEPDPSNTRHPPNRSPWTSLLLARSRPDRSRIWCARLATLEVEMFMCRRKAGEVWVTYKKFKIDELNVILNLILNVKFWLKFSSYILAATWSYKMYWEQLTYMILFYTCSRNY